MSGRRIVFLGDCQAMALAQLYAEFVAPLARDAALYVSSTLPASQDELQEIRTAEVVVSEVFNVAQQTTAEGRRRDAVLVEFPAAFIGFLWPFSGQAAHVRNRPTALLSNGPYPAQVGDTFLNHLVLEGVKPAEALERYLELDIVQHARLDRLLDLHIGGQAARDERTGVALAPIIESRFRDTNLFLTSSHPTLPLFAPVIRHVFAGIGVPGDLVEVVIGAQRILPFPPEALPIHPGIVRHFGLRFVDEGSRYRTLLGDSVTFAEFVLRYMDYRWNEPLLEGQRLAHGQDLDKALEVLDGALVSSPESIPGWRAKSLVLRRMSRFVPAQDAASRAVGLDPNDPASRAELAQALLEGGDLQGAEAEAREAVRSFDGDGNLHLILAQVLTAAGKLPEATAAAERAVALRPADARMHASLADLLLEQNRLAEAKAALGRAIELNPGSEGHKAALAHLLTRMGEHDAAGRVIEDLLRMNGQDPHIYASMGQLLAEREHFIDAERAFRKAVDLERSPTFLGALANLLARLPGRDAEALALTREALAGGSRNPHTYGLLGHLLVRREDLEGAEAALHQAAELDPTVTGFRIALADVLAREGKNEEGAAVLRDLIATGETGGDPHVHALLGHVLAGLGDITGAEAAFQTASEMDPNLAGLRVTRADMLVRQGRDEEATILLQDAIAAGEVSSPAYALLGDVLSRAGELIGAEEAFRQAIALDPEAPSPREGLADVLYRQGLNQDAAAAPETADDVAEAAPSPSESPPEPAVPDIEVPDIVAAIESIGRNCEFGAIQREVFGLEPVSLLRWAGSDRDSLTRALRYRFQGLAETMSGEAMPPEAPTNWWLTDQRYGILFHTGESVTDTSVEEATAAVRARLRRLAEMLLESIADADKLFLYSDASLGSWQEASDLHEAFRRNGPAFLLVVIAAPGRAGQAEYVQDGLIAGYVRELTPARQADTYHWDTWPEMLLRAYAIWARERLGASGGAP